MTFTSLPDALKIILIALSALSLIFQTRLTAIHVHEKKKKILICIEIAVSIISFAICIVMAYIALSYYIDSILNALFIALSLLGFTYLIGIVCAILCIFSYAAYNKSVTRSSIKEAFYAIDEAVLIAEKSGKPIIVNEKMNSLSLYIFGKPITDANSFYKAISELSDNEKFKKITLFDNCVLRLARGDAWEFSFLNFSVKDKDYLRIIAYDVSEKIYAAEQSQKNISAIKDCENSLQWTHENLDSIKKEFNIYSSEAVIHERIIECVKNIEAVKNSSTQHELSEILSELGENGALSAEDILNCVKFALRLLGVSLTVIGKIPNDRSAASVIDTLRILTFFCTEICNANKLTAALYEGGSKITVSVTAESEIEEDEHIKAQINAVKSEIKMLAGEITVSLSPALKISAVITKSLN